MFPNNLTQRLVHLQCNPPHKPEAELPRGECRHVERSGGYDTAWSRGQRCICQGFSLDKQQVVGTSCECGHPAWTHVQQPMGVVTYEEHEALADEVRRFKDDFYNNYQNLQNELARTQQELVEQRAVNNDRERVFKLLEARMYQNMKDLKIILDDKMDGIIDQQHAFQRKLIDVEDATMEHDVRLEKLFRTVDRTSREITPTAANGSDDQPMDTVDEYPEKPDHSWSIKVIMVPRKSQLYAYDVDSTAYKRLQSRNLVKELTFTGRDSISFHTVIEKHFGEVLRRRPWVPLIGYRMPHDLFGRIALKQLPLDHTYGQLWDYFFLDHHCIVHDKMQGDILHIALRDTELSWSEIKSLPCVYGFHESSWAYDTELDGPLKFLQPPTPVRAPSSASAKSEVSDFVYDYSPSPPPYTSQRNTMDPDAITPVPLENGFQSPLDVLAQASASLSPSTTGSGTGSFPLSLGLTKQQSHTQSLRSLAASSDSTDDVDSEHSHRNKIRKLRPKLSEPFMSSHHHASDVQDGGAQNHSHPNLHMGNGHAQGQMQSHHSKGRSNGTHSSSSSGSASASSSSANSNGSSSTAPPQAPTQVYYSGRSKRKMPVREKQKEPLQFKLPSLLHHRNREETA
ncbi:uncharacterized protein BKA78DRAFT_821 [Phyllosticta capitalensis]|uniref:uncharacterized protein n=1 Tax=Phyllosticta capitalensis TaxID=121624 RepID=UPI0031327997